MEPKTKKRFFAILPGLITLTVLGAFTLYGILYKAGYNPFETQSIKSDLVSKMRINLLEANAAEKTLSWLFPTRNQKHLPLKLAKLPKAWKKNERNSNPSSSKASTQKRQKWLMNSIFAGRNIEN
ncbi:MAG: hypothetical protein ABL924_09865 [Methyloglobulus sp.]